MNRLQTRGIVLKRTDYGEAGRIITVLTPDYGKLRLMAKGVRKPKSKLAGGIELFSVSDMTFIRGRGDIGTLISTRLAKHYGKIINDITRVQLGYDLLKLLDKATEDEPEGDYFDLLAAALAGLDDAKVDGGLIQAWFGAQLLKLAGHSPNLKTTASGQDLKPGQKYIFDFDRMAFEPEARGGFGANDVKFLRLLFGSHTPQQLQRVEDSEKLTAKCLPLVTTMLGDHLHV